MYSTPPATPRKNESRTRPATAPPAKLNASLTLLRLHEVRASIPGVIQTIYRRPGEAVKNLDPIMHVQNPLKLRAEALAGVQDVQNLRKARP